MRALIVLILLSALLSNARANMLYTMVLYSCDPAGNSITVRYIGAWDEEGQRLLTLRGANAFSPSDLIQVGATGRIDTTYITRTCLLREGVYRVKLGHISSDALALGGCGEQDNAWVSIQRGKKTVLSRTPFEPNCHVHGSVTTRVHLTDGAVTLETTPNEKFYGN